MPRPATLEQRVKWHVAHASVCGCRPMPRTVVAELKRRKGAAAEMERYRKRSW